MKSLIFFRHGKSDWGADYAHDHDRPLARRGRKAARDIGLWVATTDSLPDSIICSSATRTRQTMQHAAEAGSWNASSRITSQLYGASLDDILALLHQEPDATQTLMLIGHEPTCSRAIQTLTGQVVARFPTAAMARIDLPVLSWRDASMQGGALKWVKTPKGGSTYY